MDREEQVRSGVVGDLRPPRERQIGIGFPGEHHGNARFLHRLLGPQCDRERHVLLHQAAPAVRAVVRKGAAMARIEHDHQRAAGLGGGGGRQAEEQGGEASHGRQDNRPFGPP